MRIGMGVLHKLGALCAAVALVGAGVVSEVPAAQAAGENVIKDANLKACINGYFGRAETQAVTAEDVQGLSSLTCTYTVRVDSVEGLQYATNLVSLYLSSAWWDPSLPSNQMSDVSALGNLTNLRELYLDGSRVSDVTPLGKLTNLQKLGLSYNQVSDVSALGSLTNLRELDLDGNRVSDVSALGKLTKLDSLELRDNRVSDVSALGKLTHLQKLELSDNRVSDVSALGKLTNLQMLALVNNQVSDVSALGNLTNLRELYLNGSRVSDVTPLGKLTNLQKLELSGNQVSDVSALGNLTNLGWLDLSGNQVLDWRSFTPEKGESYSYSLDGTGQWGVVTASVSGAETTYDVSNVYGVQSTPIDWQVGTLVPSGDSYQECDYDATFVYRGQCFVPNGRTVTLSSDKQAVTVGGDMSVVDGAVLYGEWEDGSFSGSFVLEPSYSVFVSSVDVEGRDYVNVGAAIQLSATVNPAHADNKAITWKSSDTSVATVDANGKVTAKKAGTVTITATAKDGSGKSGSLKVTVTAKPTPSPSPTVTPSPSVKPSPTSSPKPSVSPSPTVTPSPSSSPKPSVSPSPSVKPSPTSSPKPTTTPSVKPSPTSSPSPSVPVGQCLVKSGPASFRDVPGVHPFVADISWLSQRGITTGWADGTFRPSESVTRAAFAAFLYRMAGCPSYTPPKVSPFVDVPTSHQFYREISWLASKSVTRGWPDGTFRPEAKIQRDALSTFLYRFAGEPKFTATKSFRDTATSEHKKAIDWFASTGISTGWSDGTFRPSNETERAAIAAFLHRFSDKKIPIAVR